MGVDGDGAETVETTEPDDRLLRFEEMKIAYRVQHYDTGRDAALERLLPFLPKHTEVVTDEGNPNPCRGFLRCFENLPDATHMCDPGRRAALQRIRCGGRVGRWRTARRCDLLVRRRSSGRTKRDFLGALGDGARWSPIYFSEIHHVVGLVWPIPVAEEFVAWFADARVPGPKPPRSDDAVVGYWARTSHRLFWATVPCLVEHPDDFPSVVQNSNRFGDKGRRAIAFLDDL